MPSFYTGELWARNQTYSCSTMRRDARNPAVPVRTHTYTHSDDITAVHFLRSRPSHSNSNILLSISSDGLLSTSNADEPDEDEAGMYVGNWGCSIAQAGWIHGRSGSPAVWASSDMETFSTWSHEVSLPMMDLFDCCGFVPMIMWGMDK